MTPKHTTDQDFEKDLPKEGLAIVDLWAEWCGPCRMIAPILEELSEDLEGLTVLKLNVDENPELAAQWGIRSIPTLIIFKDGIEMERIIGAVPKDKIIAVLTQYA